jgi:hypothetical protein
MKVWLLRLFGFLGEFLAVLFQKGIAEELKVVLPIVTRYVKAVANDPSLITGESKREVVFATVLSELGAAQLQVGSSVINLAIELAVQKFKNE